MHTSWPETVAQIETLLALEMGNSSGMGLISSDFNRIPRPENGASVSTPPTYIMALPRQALHIELTHLHIGELRPA